MEQEVAKLLAEGYLRVNLVVELAGRPKEHAEQTFKIVVNRFTEEDGVHVVEGKVHPAKEQDNYFITFAEFDALIKDYRTLVRIIFDYLPSSVEIVEPSTVKMKLVDFNNFVNDMVGGLHRIDLKLKENNVLKAKLEKNSTQLLRNFVEELLRAGPMSTERLADRVGISAENMVKFLEAFEKQKVFAQNDGAWHKV